VREADLFVALRQRFPAEAYALFAQVPDGTGSNQGRTADAIAMSLWPSRGLEVHGFEIKVSRADWLKELANPAKAEAIARFCDRWWVVVADVAHVKDDELPPGWGLLALKTAKLHQVKAAPKRKPLPITSSFLAGLLRAAQKADPDMAAIEAARTSGFEAGKKAGLDQGASALRRAQDDLRAERMARQKFEEASGLNIGHYSAGRIGSAVHALMNGGAAAAASELRRLQSHARSIANGIDHELAQLDQVVRPQAQEGVLRGA
jgi:hypothetical protein